MANAWQLARFKVNGALFGQAVNNVFYFVAEGGMDNAAMIGRLRQKWREELLPFVSTSYAVANYGLEVITGFRCVVDNKDPEAPVLKYIGTNVGAKLRLGGGELDIGAKVSASNAFVLPSFAAVGVQKGIGQTFHIGDDTGEVGLGVNPWPAKAGGCRIGGLMEYQNTDANGNLVKSTDRESFRVAMNRFRRFNFTNLEGNFGTSLQMYVVSTRHEAYTATGGWRVNRGSPASTDPNQWTSEVAAAPVESISINSYLRSQTSRVQNEKYN